MSASHDATPVHRTLTDDQLRLLSVRIERETGFDSIPTIEQHYSDDDGYFACVFPGCRRRTRTSARMWRHVHWEHNDEHGQALRRKHIGPVAFQDLTMDIEIEP